MRQEGRNGAVRGYGREEGGAGDGGRDAQRVRRGGKGDGTRDGDGGQAWEGPGSGERGERGDKKGQGRGVYAEGGGGFWGCGEWKRGREERGHRWNG